MREWWWYTFPYRSVFIRSNMKHSMIIHPFCIKRKIVQPNKELFFYLSSGWSRNILMKKEKSNIPLMILKICYTLLPNFRKDVFICFEKEIDTWVILAPKMKEKGIRIFSFESTDEFARKSYISEVVDNRDDDIEYSFHGNHKSWKEWENLLVIL